MLLQLKTLCVRIAVGILSIFLLGIILKVTTLTKTYEIAPIAKAEITDNRIWKGYEKLKRICSCESWGSPDKDPRQFRDGRILWSDAGTNDVGACQINLDTWSKTAKTMKLDIINNFGDNVKMAKWIYDKDPRHEKNWNWSRNCWNSKKPR